MWVAVRALGVNWIAFDEEASFFTRDEAGVFGFTDHQRGFTNLLYGIDG